MSGTEDLLVRLDRARLTAQWPTAAELARTLLSSSSSDQAVALAALAQANGDQSAIKQALQIDHTCWDAAVLDNSPDIATLDYPYTHQPDPRKFPYRLVLLALARFTLARLLELNEARDRAIEVYCEAIRLLAGNIKGLLANIEKKDLWDRVFGKAKMNSPSGNALDHLMEYYAKSRYYLEISNKIECILPLGQFDSDEGMRTVGAKNDRDQELQVMAFEFVVGDLIVAVISAIADLKLKMGNRLGALEDFRSILGISFPLENVKQEFSGLSKAFQSNGNNPALIACRCALYSKFSDILTKSISKSQYISPENSSGRGKNLDYPKSAYEEAVLLLQISLRDARKIYPSKSKAISSLRGKLCSLLCQMGQFSMASDILRSAVASDMDNFSSWYKLSVSLIASQDYGEALIAVKNCLRIEPDDFDSLLLASKICLNYLCDSASAVEYSRKALEVADKNSGNNGQKNLAQYVYGVCCSKNAYEVTSFSKRKLLQENAYNNLQEVYQVSKQNFKAVFHLAAIQADIREVSSATSTTKEALRVNPSDSSSWQLLALLGSARKQYKNAIVACNAGIQECGELNQLLFTRILVQMQELYDLESENLFLPNAKSILSGFKSLLKKEFPKLKYSTYDVKDLKCPFFQKEDDSLDSSRNPSSKGASGMSFICNFFILNCF
jgi:tetratricopeptide (TPR) repeat protein